MDEGAKACFAIFGVMKEKIRNYFARGFVPPTCYAVAHGFQVRNRHLESEMAQSHRAPYRRYWKQMLDWSQCEDVERNPHKVSGSWVFKGTRVPVNALFENLEGGASVDDFLAWFPGVQRKQVETVLEHASPQSRPVTCTLGDSLPLLNANSL